MSTSSDGHLPQQVINLHGQPVGLPVTGWKPPAPPSADPMQGRFCRVERLKAGLHAEDLWNAMSLDAEGKMWTYLPYGPFSSREAYSAWLDEMSQRSDPLFYAIMDQATQRAVGVASYLRIDPPNGAIEVGHLQFSPLLQRSPAATEAMCLMMERAFALGYRRYEWKCDALNAPSRAAALRLGFAFEGLFRQAVVVKGRNRDTAWFSIIDTEWPALREAFQRWLAQENFDADGVQRERLSELTACLRRQGLGPPSSAACP
ncbi:MAG: GNAT family N-acetyltransferase [Prosthecobacter sp.]